MDHHGYWYRYLLARQDFTLTMAIAMLGIALACLVSGLYLDKRRGFVSRADDPRAFWSNVIPLIVFSAVLFALYFYIA